LTAKTLVLGIIKRNYLALYRYFGGFSIKLPYNRKQTVTNQGVRLYPPPLRNTRNMSNKTTHLNAQPVSYYVISVEDMPGFVASLIQEYKDAQQVTPIESKQEQRDLMSIAEVCEYLHVTAATLHNWHRLHYLTKRHIGRKVYYDRQDVVALKNANNK